MIQGIIEIVSENADACAAVGRNVANTKPKFYWVVVGENEKPPYVCFAMLGNQPTQVKNETSSLDSVTFGAYIYGHSPERTDAIQRALRSALEYQHITTADCYFHRIFLVNEVDGFDKEAQKPFRLATYTAQYSRINTTPMTRTTFHYQDDYDASGNVFPSEGGSGQDGAIRKGDWFFISVPGILDGVAVEIGANIIARVDNPGQTKNDWYL